MSHNQGHSRRGMSHLRDFEKQKQECQHHCGMFPRSARALMNLDRRQVGTSTIGPGTGTAPETWIRGTVFSSRPYQATRSNFSRTAIEVKELCALSM